MASSILDGALLALVVILLPLHLLSFALRLLGKPDRRHGRDGSVRSVLLLATVAVLLAAVFALSDSPPGNRPMVTELEELRFKTAQLESILEESTRTLNFKAVHLEEKKKVMADMEQKIKVLQEDLNQTKELVSDSLPTEDSVHALEEEVQLLRDQLQKNSYSIKILESSADDAKEKAEIAASKVVKMESVVREQWIQIQQLEQAFQLTKMMALKVQQRNLQKGHNNKQRSSNSLIMKVSRFIEGIRRNYQPEGLDLPDSFFLAATFSKSIRSQAYNLVKRITLLAQECHYELQDLVKHAMDMNKYTAPFANEFIVFTLASAIMATPLMVFGSFLRA